MKDIFLKDKSLSNGNGFTLFEILIALAIIAIVFTGLFSVFNNALKVADDVKRAENLDQVARAALLQINDDLRSLYTAYPKVNKSLQNESLPKENKELKKQKGYQPAFQGNEFIAEKNEEQVLLEFYSASSLDFNQHYPRLRVNRIIYTLRKPKRTKTYSDFDEKPLYLLLRKEVPFAGENLDKKEKVFELASNVVSCTLKFQNSEGEKFLSWQGVEKDQRTPSLINITLVLKGEQEQERNYRLNVELPQKQKEDAS